MTILQAIILGIIEGFTEFLPVSSTAHLLLAQRLMDISMTQSVATFTIAIQFGSICAAAFLYRGYFLSIRNNLILGVALLPTILVGILAYPYIKVFFANVLFIVPWTLVGGGILMLYAEYVFRGKKVAPVGEITTLQKVYLGTAQILAFIPGVSRSASMVVCGLLLGLSRPQVSAFTFVLAVPTMLAATSYDIYKNFDVVRHDLVSPVFIAGFLIACAAAFFSIRFMLYIVRTYTFVPFAWYRIFLGFMIGALLFLS